MDYKELADRVLNVLKNADDPKTINNAKLAQQLCGIIITK